MNADAAVTAHEEDIADLHDEIARLRRSRKLTAREQADAIGRCQRLIRDHRAAIDALLRRRPNAPGEMAPAAAFDLDGAVDRLVHLDDPAAPRIDITAEVRAMAVREGIDPDQAVRDAEALMAEVDARLAAQEAEPAVESPPVEEPVEEEPLAAAPDEGGGVRLHVEYADLVYRTLHDLSETPRIAFGDGGGDRSGVALQLELDPLLRKVARKRLRRTAALRKRDRLILRLLAHHTGQPFDDVRTDISWGPVFPREPGALPAVTES